MLLEGIIQRIQGVLANRTPTSIRLTAGGGSVAIAQFEADGDEASRAGVRYYLQSSAATGIAPVQALPTTAAQWLIYNPIVNMSTIWLDLLGVLLNSGTAGAGGTLLFGLCGAAQLPTTRPTASAAGVVLSNANPRSSKGTSGLIVAASQTLIASPGWAPIAFMNPAGTVLGQTQIEEGDLRGRIALAPDSGVALAVISPTGTTPLWAPYGSYREYSSDME